MPTQSHLADRRWLEGTYLPSLAGSVLFIGVRWYNAGYQTLVRDPDLFETVDCDISQASFGAYHHHICHAETLAAMGQTYDHIVAHGLFGMADSVLAGEQITDFLNMMAPACRKTFCYGASTDTMSLRAASAWFVQSAIGGWTLTHDEIVVPSPHHSPMLIRVAQRP